MHKLPDSTIKVLIEGSSRAVIERFIDGEPHLRVEVALLEEEFLPSPELEGLMRGVVDLFDRYVELDKKVPPEVNLTVRGVEDAGRIDRKSTRLNSSHQIISYAVFCLKKKKIYIVKNETHKSTRNYIF